MSAPLPHVAIRLALVALVPGLLAACEPTWQGGAPVWRQTQAATGCGAAARVHAGDTVFGIARRCNVSVRDVIEANGLTPPYVVHPGDILRMPGGGEHVVRRGDTLLGLARQYRVDFRTLARTNNKSAPYTIFVGERLSIPGSYASQTAPAAPARSTGPLVIASPNTPEGRRAAAVTRPPPPPAPADGPVSPAPSPEVARHDAFAPQQALPPEPPPLAGRGFGWPLKGEVVAEFGPLAKGQNNDGINIAAPRGTPVRAAENGVIAYAGNELKGFGNLLLIKHADGWMTAYAHNDQLMVSRGDSVKRGQQIATVGATGNVASPQLHFEIRKGTEAVNPLDHLGSGAAVSQALDATPGA